MKKIMLTIFSVFLLVSCFKKADKTEKDISVCRPDKLLYNVCKDQYVNYKESYKASKETKKNMLIVFGFEACPWCHSLHKILSTSSGRERLAKMNLNLLEVGILNHLDEPAGDGYKVFVKTLLMSTLNPNKIQKSEAYPTIVLLNPTKQRSILVATGELEKNTNKSKGHDEALMWNTLEKAIEYIN